MKDCVVCGREKKLSADLVRRALFRARGEWRREATYSRNAGRPSWVDGVVYGLKLASEIIEKAAS